MATLLLAFGHASADSSHDDNRLHFSHPLITESPSPDTKARLDYVFADEPDDAKRHTFRFEGEYALAPWLSLEVDVPYTLLDVEGEPNRNHLDTVEGGLKYANFGLADYGLLLGGGLELGLPTGDDDSNRVVNPT
jgi:hypothetical protein